ncbi:protein FAM13A isoform X2 [Octopus sinensis]|nr:protein FAM13A isoform X2 [Octopus sinensis]XP_036355708.1 protein FAM13A isoform X2 [Octopus sinensis]
MDRVRKLLSPGTKKKTVPQNSNKTFGVPLEELVRQAPDGLKIPLIVKKICEHIENHGYDQEGIFRVNGSTRIIDKLRTSFDQTGDADFTEDGDVMAVAGLLKLFLRELPDSVIPEHMTKQFVNIHESLNSNPEDYVAKVREEFNELPEEHYDLLKYLLNFLVDVSQHEEENKMGPMVLAIVFGPNVFRCGSDFSGLKDQSTTNNIVYKFIIHYHDLFADENHASSKCSECNNRTKNTGSTARPMSQKEDRKSVTLPRKNKQQCDCENTLHADQSNIKDSPQPSCSNISNNATSQLTTSMTQTSSVLLPGPTSHHQSCHSQNLALSFYNPRLSDEDLSGRMSPFTVESDSGHSMIESPVVSVVASSIVEKTIREAIVEHVFGGYQTGDMKQERNSNSSSSGRVLDVKKTDRKSPDHAFDLNKSSVIDPKRQKTKCTRTANEISGSSIGIQGEDIVSPKSRRPLQHSTVANQMKNINETQQPHYSPRHGTIECWADPDSDAICHKFESSNMDNILLPQSGLLKHPLSVDHHTHKSSTSSPSSSTRCQNQNKPYFKLDCSKSSSTMPEHTSYIRGSVRTHMGTSTADNNCNAVQFNPKHPHLVEMVSANTADVSSTSSSSCEEDENTDSAAKHPKSRIGFLDMHLTSSQSRDEENDDMCERDEKYSPCYSPNNNRKTMVPPLDLSILHEHMDSTDPIPSKKVQTVSYQRVKKHLSSDEDDDDDDDDPVVVLSPRANKFKKKPIWTTGNDEAPLSPSTQRPGFWHSVSSNTDIPPSPPVEQEQYRNVAVEDEYTTRLKQLTKKIQSLRKKIKLFEENFEREHGYRPSQSDKTAKAEIKKYMADLAKARKEIKKLKEEAEMSSRSRHGSGASSGGSESPTTVPTMEQTLESIIKKLKEKRRDARRPEELELMSRDEIQEEKLAIQKSLLHFEGIHGRPSSKISKDLMRPLYNHYRLVKRMLAKPASPRDTTELQTVPEDQPFELTAGVSTSARPLWKKTVHVPTAEMEDDENFDTVADFSVTRDLVLTRDTIKVSSAATSAGSGSPKSRLMSTGESSINQEATLHEMTIPQLQEELTKTRVEKRKLRKILRDFENEFLSQHGRKVQKEDKIPLQEDYQEYKQVKARLRLLEALLSKYQQQKL